MKIVVCIKQVPDTSDIKWTENNTMQREGVESIINSFDLYALEQALNIKKKLDNVEITAVTMGPSQAEDVLKYAISIGCDNGVLLTDKKFAGADTYATAKTLSAGIKLLGYDLILCGQYAIDGDTAQTGPGIASQLDIPQVTFVKNLDRYSQDSFYAVRELEDGDEVVKVELPSLACILKGNYETTRPSINGIKKAQTFKITQYTMEDIGLTVEDVGIKGSPTFVSKAFKPEHNRGECTYCQTYASLAEKIKGYVNE